MARNIILKIPAKINLSLDITGRRPDGYHTLRSVFQTVGVFDTLTVTETAPGEPMTLTCTDSAVPCDARNLVWKAAVRLLGDAPCGFSMQLEKHIPSQAGMGGGSADCAAALIALREMFSPETDDAALLQTAAGLGADVPFFLHGGTVLAEGIGEVLTPLEPLKPCQLVIAKGSSGISTPEAYRRIDTLGTSLPDTTDAVLDALHGDAEALFAVCGNHFDAVTDLPEVCTIREIMRAHGIRPVLSGSGAAVFGGCTDREQADRCTEALRKAGLPFAETVLTVPHGITAERVGF